MIRWFTKKNLHFAAEIVAFGLIAAILVVLVLRHPPQNDRHKPDNTVSLKKNWDYTLTQKSGQAPVWEPPAMKTTADFQSMDETSSGTVWFRKNINVDKNWAEPVLAVNGYFGKLDIYLDGKLIASDKIPETLNGISIALAHGYTIFPLDKPQQTDTAGNLVLRFSHPEGIYNPPIEILLGNHPDLLIYDLKKNISKLLIIGFAILSGIFTIAVFLYHGTFKYNLESGLGTFLLFIGFFMLGNSSLSLYLYNNFLFWAITSSFSYLLFPFGMIHIFLDVFGAGHWNIILHLKKIHRLFFYAGIPVILTQLYFPPNPGHLLNELLIYFILSFSLLYNAIIVGGLLVMTLISATRIFKREKNSLIFTIGVLPTVIAAYHDIYISRFTEHMQTYSHWSILVYLFAVMVIVGNSRREKDLQMEHYSREVLKLESMLKEAEIKSLQDRMDPHFLFNSLNTIYALSRSDAEQTGKAILSLAENYRFLLDKTGDALIDFEDEWLFAVNYLQLFHYRYADILETEIAKNGSFANIKIPPFTIQPLLENIFKHGFKKIEGKWKIKLRAAVVDGRVEISIADNGNGLAHDADIMGRSIGNIRARLLHYFPDAEFTVAGNRPSGLHLNISYTPVTSEI